MNTIWHKSDAEKQRELKILEARREVVHPELPPGFQTARECAETSQRLYEGFCKIYSSPIEENITGDMLAAGVKAFYEYDSRFDTSPDSTVEEIFRVMCAARRG
jgi:hypothetical protein